jgi:parallel beta-helix repeat protein
MPGNGRCGKCRIAARLGVEEGMFGVMARRASPRWLVTRIAIAALIAIAAITRTESDASAKTLALSPQDNIQDAVEANAPGTTFVLRPGVYREASITSLKDGDSFIGRPGAILNGAKPLTGWTRVSIRGDDYWTTAGGKPLISRRCAARGSCCLADYPGCVYVQNLYVDNVDYRHVIALAAVEQGAWYYDFDGTDGGRRNNIYMALSDNPNSRKVEFSDTYYAFAGAASNITIKNLVIEKYSAPIQSAAVQPEGPNWLIQNNEIRLNHGFGIKAKPGGDNVRVVGNKVHHNGEMGIGSGRVTGGLWDSNHVAYNNIDGVNVGFEAGGSKFAGNNLTISNNIVHDNYGPGLWSDSGATYNTYDHNTSYNNFGGGIRYEISRYGVIENNTVYGNSKNAQIVYTGSDHGRITGNTVINNGSGGIFVQNIVGNRGRDVVYKVVDTQVTGNTIIISERNKIAAGMLDYAHPAQPQIFSDPTNFFDHNIYKVPSRFASASSLRELLWSWGENPGRGPRSVTWSDWQTSGQDRKGTLVRSSADP